MTVVISATFVYVFCECAMLRKICLAATAVKAADSRQPTHGKDKIDEKVQYKCKPSDLPMYTPLHFVEKSKTNRAHPEDSAARKAIESGIYTVRVEVFKAINAVASQKKNIVEFVDNGKAHSKFIFDYLNEPGNSLPRVGAIAVGGLSGFILALRGGFIRRLFYTSLGSGTIASICYPKEAEKFAQNCLTESKKTATIAYNFAVGVKPGDDVNTINWPKFPTNMSEVSESISDLAKNAKDILISKK